MIGALARALGVDAAAHRALHRTFWEQSRRGGSALIAKRGDVRKSSMSAVYLTYGALGFLSGMGALLGHPMDAVATQVCATAMVLLAIAIVADFASVVVAPGDDEVLFHLPISSRTYLAARMTVAARHTAQMALAFGAGPSLIGAIAFRDVPFGLALLAGVVLAGGFALLVSFVIHRAALELLGGERLRTTLAYLPGIVSLVAALGPQLLLAPRRDPSASVATWAVLGDWALLLPPAWFAAPASLAAGLVTPALVARATIGLAALPLGALVLLRVLGGSFLQELIRLTSAKDAGPAASSAPRRRLAPGRLTRALLRLDGPEACAGYLLGVGAFRSRESRARSFPLMLFPVVLVALGAWKPGGTTFTSPVFGIYFLGAGAGTILSILPYHEHRDAGFLHEALPIRRYGRYYMGVVRAMLARILAPWMAVVLVIAIVSEPTPEGIGFALHAATGSMLATPLYASTEDDPPFSRAFVPGDQSGRLAVYFLNMLLMVIVAVVGLVIRRFAPIGFAVSVPLFATAFLVWMHAIARRLDRHPPAFLHGARAASAHSRPAF